MADLRSTPAQPPTSTSSRTSSSDYLAGDLDEDVFRVFRLNNGIYGQRQGGHNQMVRVKAPVRAASPPEQFDLLGRHRRRLLAGLGSHHHPPERPVPLRPARADPRRHARPRRASGSPPARPAATRSATCRAATSPAPARTRSSTSPPWAEATFRHFLRNPIAQRLPRKFKINFSGCEHRLRPGHVQRRRRHRHHPHPRRRTVEAGFRVFVAGGLGATPHPALALEDFTTREDLLPTIEAMLRVFDQAGNRDNKLRARMKWLVDTLGFDELQRRGSSPAATCCWPRRRWPGGIPAEVEKHGDAPAGVAARRDPAPPIGQGMPVALRRRGAYERWEDANVVRGVGQRHGVGLRLGPPRRHHLGPVPRPGRRSSASSAPRCGSPTARTWCSAASPKSSCAVAARAPRRHRHGRARRRAGPRRRGLPRRRHLQPRRHPVPRSRRRHRHGLEEAGLAEVGGIRTNISGCTNSCGQHHAADIGFFGAERRAHGQSAPGYQMLLGGYVGDEQIHFGQKALRLPAKAAPEAAVRVVAPLRRRAQAGETFRSWLDRAGGHQGGRRGPEGPRPLPHPEDDPELLRRLRRDRALRGRGRRLGVRHMSARDLTRPSLGRPPSSSDAELAELDDASSSHLPGREDHPVGRRLLRPAPRAHGVDDRRRAHRPRRRRSTRPSRSSSSTPATTSPRRSRPSRRSAATTGSTCG